MRTVVTPERLVHAMQCYLEDRSATGTLDLLSLLSRLSSDNTCETWACCSELGTKAWCSRHPATDCSPSGCVVCGTKTAVTGSKKTAFPANAQNERKHIAASITSANLVRVGRGLHALL